MPFQAGSSNTGLIRLAASGDASGVIYAGGSRGGDHNHQGLNLDSAGRDKYNEISDYLDLLTKHSE